MSSDGKLSASTDQHEQQQQQQQQQQKQPEDCADSDSRDCPDSHCFREGEGMLLGVDPALVEAWFSRRREDFIHNQQQNTQMRRQFSLKGRNTLAFSDESVSASSCRTHSGRKRQILSSGISIRSDQTPIVSNRNKESTCTHATDANLPQQLMRESVARPTPDDCSVVTLEINQRKQCKLNSFCCHCKSKKVIVAAFILLFAGILTMATVFVKRNNTDKNLNIKLTSSDADEGSPIAVFSSFPSSSIRDTTPTPSQLPTQDQTLTPTFVATYIGEETLPPARTQFPTSVVTRLGEETRAPTRTAPSTLPR